MTIKKEQLTAVELEILDAIGTPFNWGDVTDQDVLNAIEKPDSPDTPRWGLSIIEHVSDFWDRLSVESKLVCVLLVAQHAHEAQMRNWDN
ncbi:MAG: hypothetical protein WCB27_11735 [Thermoguttaceae bacterium]